MSQPADFEEESAAALRRIKGRAGAPIGVDHRPPPQEHCHRGRKAGVGDRTEGACARMAARPTHLSASATVYSGPRYGIPLRLARLRGTGRKCILVIIWRDALKATTKETGRLQRMACEPRAHQIVWRDSCCAILKASRPENGRPARDCGRPRPFST